MLKCVLAAVLAVSLTYPATTIGADNADQQYIKVEIKGVIQTGLVGIGGETTGTLVAVKFPGDVLVTWELDLGKNVEFQALAKKLNGKPVIVTGSYFKKKGVEVRERQIVKVATLKAADAK